MSKESVLKKEFKEKDLQRLRNLIKGKTGERTVTSSGYVKQQADRQEGDVWEEDGRKWTIKNGVKQNISKLQELRQAAAFPLFCPKCKKKMSTKYDKPIYTVNRHCFECQLQFEKKLKLEGKYEEYQNTIHNSEIDGLINNYEMWVDDLINETNDGFVTEQGDVEKWSKLNTTNIVQQKDEAVEALKKLKK
jgi:hypothetical protein